MTVGELIEKLNNCPKDYNIELTVNYQDWVDGGWSTMHIDDITSVFPNDKSKSVTIVTYN